MRIVPAIIGAAALLISANGATAQQYCSPRDHAVMQLEQEYKERVSGRGLTEDSTRMIELYVSERGTWTLLASDPWGRSCVIASGDNWQGIRVLVGDPA